MHFLIAGAGAIGGYLGARLAQKGEKVTLFARGPHLKAMQERGLRVRSGEGDFEVHPRLIGSLDVVGSIAYIAADIAEPGEPDGSKSERLKVISQVLINTGMRAPVPNASTPRSGLRFLGMLRSIRSVRLCGQRWAEWCEMMGSAT
jgi:nucleoside-diphosphate-sugar epimerase